MKIRKDYSTKISKEINSLDSDQLNTLFDIYSILNCKCNFFMPEQTYIDYINFYHETSSKKHINTYKTLLTVLATSYTYPSKYSYVLNIITMIKYNYPLDTIIKTIYHPR